MAIPQANPAFLLSGIVVPTPLQSSRGTALWNSDICPTRGSPQPLLWWVQTSWRSWNIASGYIWIQIIARWIVWYFCKHCENLRNRCKRQESKSKLQLKKSRNDIKYLLPPFLWLRLSSIVAPYSERLSISIWSKWKRLDLGPNLFESMIWIVVD